jgi:hypothetical protein
MGRQINSFSSVTPKVLKELGTEAAPNPSFPTTTPSGKRAAWIRVWFAAEALLHMPATRASNHPADFGSASTSSSGTSASVMAACALAMLGSTFALVSLKSA